MSRAANRAWVPSAAIVAGVYLVAGPGFGWLAGATRSSGHVVAWRLAAWVVSALAFGAHILYEHARLANRPRTAGWHVSVAVAIGAFGLAVAANLHPHSGAIAQRLRLSLVLWPLITAVPALIVALVLASGLAWLRRAH